jgi:folate-binding protein YgfZ
VWIGARSLAPVDGARSHGVVSLAGPDARRFCNGMFTNNARDLRPGSVQRSAVVDDRGRIGGFLDLLCAAEDRFVAVLDGLTPEAFLERFEKFVVFDDVALGVETLELGSIQGPAAAGALAVIGIAPPAAGTFAAVDGLFAYPSRRSPAGGYAIAAPAGDPRLSLLASRCVAAEVEEAELLRVLAGRPRYPHDTGDKRLPHELGLRDELLSFDKGCYIGQETINRVDVMGDVKRALVGVRIEGDAPVAAGAELRSAASADAVGAVTSPAALPDGGWIALAVVRKPADAPGTEVTLASADGGSRSARITALPFPATVAGTVAGA